MQRFLGHSAQVEVRGHVQEVVLSFHSMGPRVQLGFSGLAERAFTHWVILITLLDSSSDRWRTARRPAVLESLETAMELSDSTTLFFPTQGIPAKDQPHPLYSGEVEKQPHALQTWRYLSDMMLWDR